MVELHLGLITMQKSISTFQTRRTDETTTHHQKKGKEQKEFSTILSESYKILEKENAMREIQELIVEHSVYSCCNCGKIKFSEYGEWRDGGYEVQLLSYAIPIICPQCRTDLHLTEIPFKKRKE